MIAQYKSCYIIIKQPSWMVLQPAIVNPLVTTIYCDSIVLVFLRIKETEIVYSSYVCVYL